MSISCYLMVIEGADDEVGAGKVIKSEAKLKNGDVIEVTRYMQDPCVPSS